MSYYKIEKYEKMDASIVGDGTYSCLPLFIGKRMLPGEKKKGKNEPPRLRLTPPRRISAYDKLFQRKSRARRSKSNFITLHKVGWQIVFRDTHEVLWDREMLLASTVDERDLSAMIFATWGTRQNDPLAREVHENREYALFDRRDVLNVACRSERTFFAEGD